MAATVEPGDETEELAKAILREQRQADMKLAKKISVEAWRALAGKYSNKPPTVSDELRQKLEPKK